MSRRLVPCFMLSKHCEKDLKTIRILGQKSLMLLSMAFVLALLFQRPIQGQKVVSAVGEETMPIVVDSFSQYSFTLPDSNVEYTGESQPVRLYRVESSPADELFMLREDLIRHSSGDHPSSSIEPGTTEQAARYKK